MINHPLHEPEHSADVSHETHFIFLFLDEPEAKKLAPQSEDDSALCRLRWHFGPM